MAIVISGTTGVDAGAAIPEDVIVKRAECRVLL